MAVVGIDLGTTYSVIATPQKFEGKYFEAVRGITIIKDKYTRRITPSVVAVDRQGNLLVGHKAKNRAGQKPEPIMFVKLSMGEARQFTLGERSVQPEDVSAEILRYLKTMAEEQMGEEIEEAVITVPAYFTTLQRQKTKEAGELAGLRVGKILHEPVAAALTYCYDDTRDPLTIMTYDLGGGTFDVAILKKEGGVFEIKAFDGDRYLGGYNFDAKLVRWIIDHLNKDYQLDITADSPEWRKLMVLAETAKIKLSSYESFELLEQDSGIVDNNDETVSLEIEITRDTFEHLIDDYISETIRLCRQAMKKANPRITPQEIDEIVMVGGSSRIPLISKRLEAEFGRKPRLIDPDLCVAVGAAIMARQLGRRIGPLKLGYIPESTTLASVQITGILEPTEELPNIVGCTVILTPADNSLSREEPIRENGGFVFPQVPLAAGVSNGFTLRVEDALGGEILTHRFVIQREVGETQVQTTETLADILSKPISIKTVSGLHTVAPERTRLPYEAQIPAQTTSQIGEVRIPIYEDVYQIGEIVVESIPTDLRIGSQVDITLSLRTDFFIEGRAYIPAAKAEGRTTIQIQPVKVKSIEDLREQYLELSRQAKESLDQADRGQAFSLAPQLKRALAASQKLLYEDRDPTLAKAQGLLAEVETLIQQLSSIWRPDPHPERFEGTKKEIEEELLPELYTLKPAASDGTYEGRLKAIINQGKKALDDKQEAMWAEANRQLDDLHDLIVSVIEEEERRRKEGSNPEKPPDPKAIKLKLGTELTWLEEEAKRNKRLSDIETDLASCEQTLKGIDPEASDAMNYLYDYYYNLHKPLYKKVAQRKSRSSIDNILKYYIKVPEQNKKS
jgi:molecular chaperone DnaK (HSP70)